MTTNAFMKFLLWKYDSEGTAPGSKCLIFSCEWRYFYGLNKSIWCNNPCMLNRLHRFESLVIISVNLSWAERLQSCLQKWGNKKITINLFFVRVRTGLSVPATTNSPESVCWPLSDLALMVKHSESLERLGFSTDVVAITHMLLDMSRL